MCSGLALEIYNQATASWIRLLNDSMTMYGAIALMLVALGLASGFLFGRAPKLFLLMIAVTVMTFFMLGLWSRHHPVERLPPPQKAWK
jgi:hypothetical protein